jgi:hypothetical protein
VDKDLYRVTLPNGQPSQPFDAQNLQSYVAAGHIQRGTWIFVELEGRWMAASEVPAIQSMWAQQVIPPQYSAPYVQQVNPKGNAIGKWLLALMIFAMIAVFVILLPLFIRGPHRTSSSASMGTIVMKTNDGLYSVTLPGNWVPGVDQDANVPVYDDADANRTISIRKMTAYPCNSQQVKALCAARTTYDYNNRGWIAIGSAAPITISGFHGWMQTLNGQYEGNTRTIHLNVISTPHGVYDIAEQHYSSDPDGQLIDDNFVKSFQSVIAQAPPTTF